MGLNSEDPINFIKYLLESKSTAKQTAYKHICRAFSVLEAESRSVVEELKRRANPSDKDVTIESPLSRSGIRHHLHCDHTDRLFVHQLHFQDDGTLV